MAFEAFASELFIYINSSENTNIRDNILAHIMEQTRVEICYYFKIDSKYLMSYDWDGIKVYFVRKQKLGGKKSRNSCQILICQSHIIFARYVLLDCFYVLSSSDSFQFKHALLS